MNSLCGLILAAGLSSRMGESKPLLEWFGQTLIEYQINLFNSLNIKPLVVLVKLLSQKLKIWMLI